MLRVTLAAVEAILQIMQDEDANGLRLRIGSRRFSREAAVQLEAAAEPRPEDIVLDVDRARLYLDEETQELTQNMILDADLTGAEPRFKIHPQRRRVGPSSRT